MEVSPATSPALLCCDQVSVEFPRLTAVTDVSFQLNGGDLLGLIGPNGAGKTTLLRAICGLQHAHGGQVRILDEPVKPGAAILRQVGFTPDTPPAYESLSVRQYLRFIGKGYGLSADETEERTAFWLEKVWLTQKIDQKVKELSRGMRQRLGIARTLLPNPAVILLDEPAAGLDPAGRVQFRRLLCDLRDQGKAIIVSSHILADMNEYCTHIGILSGGVMAKLGTVQQIAADIDDGRCAYELTLSRPVTTLREDLMQIDGVANVSLDRLRVTLDYQQGAEAAADLLARLVRAGVPVASFAPRAIDLESVYLRTGVKQVD